MLFSPSIIRQPLDMVKNFGKTLTLLVILLLYATTSVSQTETKPVYELLDSAIHVQNTDLANGTEYIEQHIIKSDDHKFFQNLKYLKGNVVYEGQPYYNLDLKYNVYDDLILVRIPTAGGVRHIELHKSRVQAFNINGHNFIALKESTDERKQFYEVLLDVDDTLLLKKHRKKIKKHLDRSFTYFEFKKDSPKYFVSINDTLHEIDSRRAIRKLFPEKKEQIDNFYRSNPSLQRSNPDEFLTILFKILALSTSELNIN